MFSPTRTPTCNEAFTKGQEMRSMEKSVKDGGDAINARSATRQDSWVDAAITLLATIVFGLGWTLVELERADPPLNRYDAAASEMWIAAVATSIEARAVETRAADAVPVGQWGAADTRWTELALQRSNR
jgi:hypothetical protein